MTEIDYNGSGFWSVDQILSRYVDYVKKYEIHEPCDLSRRDKPASKVVMIEVSNIEEQGCSLRLTAYPTVNAIDR